MGNKDDPIEFTNNPIYGESVEILEPIYNPFTDDSVEDIKKPIIINNDNKNKKE